MPAIRMNAAAAILGVSPSTLRSWERRFDFPQPRRTPGGHRQFELGEVEALRAALDQTHNISSAIAIARERGSGPATPMRLRVAFSQFDEGEAARVLEESVTVRSLERTVEEVLLPAVALLGDGGPGSPAEYGFAWRWATGWLAATHRLTPAATRHDGILIFDAGGVCDLDALHAQALELVLRRAGLRTLTLTATIDPSRLTRAVRALEPRAVVLAGRGVSADACARLVFAARRLHGDRVGVFDYRGALPETGATTVERLGSEPLAARERLLAFLQPAAGAPGPVAAARRRLHSVAG